NTHPHPLPASFPSTPLFLSAIRSFVFLARIPDGKFAMARHIAEEEKIPAYFLAKILQELTRKGLLRSSKGPSEEHTSELQSRFDLVCRLLLEKKKKKPSHTT